MKSCSCWYSIICLCQIILISSEKKSLHINKYYVYISYKFYGSRGSVYFWKSPLLFRLWPEIHDQLMSADEKVQKNLSLISWHQLIVKNWWKTSFFKKILTGDQNSTRALWEKPYKSYSYFDPNIVNFGSAYRLRL